MDRNQSIRAIRDATDIVSLVSEKVKLRKSGSGWLGGPCPIHGGGSKTPCISVQPDKGQWHCLAGETMVQTRYGRFRIDELARLGESEALMPDGTWRTVSFRSFGTQRLFRILLSRNGIQKEVFATAEHRWFTRDYKQTTTINLRSGHRLLCCLPAHPKDEDFDPDGVRYERLCFQVQSVTQTDRIEEVYCAQVPEFGAFVLEDGIVTGNCFSCGKGGDAIDWMQEVNGLTFMESVEDLGKRAGIELPKNHEKPKDSHEDRIISALASAQEYYVAQLGRSQEALAYLQGRGLSAELLAAEGIGFAPPGWDKTSQHLHAAGLKPDVLEMAGIVTRSERGTLIDFLRDRITVPIRDARGRIIAFGGRCLPSAPDRTPKYLNTKETPVFTKGSTLFGLHRSRAKMREEGALVVEGYFDVLALWDQGVQTAVAPLGTALTEHHLDQIKRWTPKITLGFDGDDAGRSAMAKSLKMALPKGFDVRLLQLADGEDPDTWARANGQESSRLISEAPDWASFKLAEAKVGRNFAKLEDRVAAAREVAAWIAYLPEERQQEIQAAAAYELKVPLSQLKANGHSSPTATQPQKNVIAIPMDEAIQSLLCLAASGETYMEWTKQLPRSWWEHRQGACVLETYLDVDGDLESMGSEGAQAVRAAEARGATQAQIDPRRLRMRLEKEHVSRELKDLTMSLATHAMDGAMAPALQTNLNDLRSRLAAMTGRMP